MNKLKAFDAHPIKKLQRKIVNQGCCVRICDLCLRKTTMPVIYEDDLVWVSYGKKSKKVIVVWKKHEPDISDDEYDQVIIALHKTFPDILSFDVTRCPVGSVHWYCTITNINYGGDEHI